MTQYYNIKYNKFKEIDQWLVDYKNDFFELGIGDMCTVWYKFKRYIILKDVNGVHYIIDLADLIDVCYISEQDIDHISTIDDEIYIASDRSIKFDQSNPYNSMIT